MDAARSTRVLTHGRLPPHPWKPPGREWPRDTLDRRPSAPFRGRVTEFAPPFFVPQRGTVPSFSSHALTSPIRRSRSLRRHRGRVMGYFYHPDIHEAPLSPHWKRKVDDWSVVQVSRDCSAVKSSAVAWLRSALLRMTTSEYRRAPRRARGRDPPQVRQQGARRAELRVQTLQGIVSHRAHREGALQRASSWTRLCSRIGTTLPSDSSAPPTRSARRPTTRASSTSSNVPTPRRG